MNSLNNLSVIVLLFTFLGGVSHAQTISLGADSAEVIMHDSTGYVEIHPLDIPDDRGLFVYSKDGTKAVRIFGSFRMLFVMDDRIQFQPFHIDPPMLPTGENDFQNNNTHWTVNMSRVGLDALFATKVSKGFMVRFELDWKGVEESFRIRHLYFRTEHWIIGKTWTSFNALPYLPQTVGGHMTGAASGARVPQIRFYNATGNWHYQASLEYQPASLIKPDALSAESRVFIPALVGRFSYHGKWGQAGAAVILKPNRVQYTGEVKRTQSIFGYGANIGLKYIIRDRNRILFSAYGGRGIGSYIVDFSQTEIELIYNPQSDNFENMNLYGGFIAFEHDWTEAFTSTFAFSNNNTVNKDYQAPLAFHYSYKGIINLFYRPSGKMDGLVVGAEFLYAERFNKDNSSNRALRASLLLYYDF